MTNTVKQGRKKSRGIVRRSAKTIFAFFKPLLFTNAFDLSQITHSIAL